MLLGVLAALGAATCFAVCSVAQHRVASRLTSTATLDPSLLLRLVRQPLWVLGGAADLAGLVQQVLALRRAPVVLVQPLLVAGLLIAVPLAAAVDRRRLAGEELAGAVLCTGGLLAFLAVAHAQPGRDTVTFEQALPTLAVCVAVAVAVTVATLKRPPGPSRAIILASGCGVLFGVSSAMIKLVTGDLDTILASWALWAVVVLGGTGLLLSQNAFQSGALGAPLATLTILEPVAGGLVGLQLLHEQLATGPVELVLYVVIGAAVIGGIFLLARHSPAASEPPSAGPAASEPLSVGQPPDASLAGPQVALRPDQL